MKELMTNDYSYLFSTSTLIASLILLLLVYVIIVYLSTFLHELGHLIFGHITHYHLLSIQVGKLLLSKQNRKVRIKWLKQSVGGGRCTLLPPNNEFHVTAMFLGGAMMNLLVVLICCIIMPHTNSLLSLIALILAVFVNLATGVLNLIPFKHGRVESDGLCIAQISKDKTAIQCHFNQLLIAEELSRGITYSEIREELFYIDNNADKRKNVVGYSMLYTYYRYMQDKKISNAHNIIKELKKYKPYYVKGLAQDIEIEEFYLNLLDTKSVTKDMNSSIIALNQIAKSPYAIRVKTALAYIESNKELYNQGLSELIHSAASSQQYPGEWDSNCLILNQFTN